MRPAPKDQSWLEVEQQNPLARPPRPSWIVILLVVDIALMCSGYVLAPGDVATWIAAAAFLLGVGLIIGSLREAWKERR